MTTNARLAVDGGTPVRRELLPYGHQTITEADIAAVVAVLRSDWITTGPKVAEFERGIASATGAADAVAFSSGTAALHAAAFAAGLGPGDEAVTTPMTFCATSNAVLYQGATPVFADVQADTLNLDPSAAAQRITRRTKAILAVDYAGHPADLDQLLALARDHRLTLIEDAAHALGAQYHGRRVGSISQMTVFSFHPVKHLTTGEGGMVTTNDAGLARRLRLFRNHGIESDARERQARGQWHYEMTALGFNYRISDIACALGLSQLDRLAANVERRRSIARTYVASFAGLSDLELPVIRDGVEPSWHLFPIRVRSRAAFDRAQLFRALRAEGIGANVHYIPVHLHPYYRQTLGTGDGDFPIAEDAFRRLVSLPMFHGMTDHDVADVVAAVTKVVSQLSE